ncbi:MAG: hypothetical protein KIT83_19905 [Bryobacterales bacterium]|nr:hypothetical protein [Bryobacterales bacterium]
MPTTTHLSRRCLLLLLAPAALRANQRLYLTDGSYHVVREFQVLEDRVRFYSVERSQWEEIPKDLVDFTRTEGEHADRRASQAEEQAMMDAEDAIERRMRREAAAIPQDAGVYVFENGKPREIPLAELEMVNDKRRSFLKVITPLPMVAGRNWVEVKGLFSPNIFRVPRPEFFIRLHTHQRFGFLKMTEHNGNRVVQTWELIPITKEVLEAQEDVADFRRQAGPMLYQIWPREDLEPGEYALVTFSPGEGNVRAWDFGYQPEGVPPTPPKPAPKKDRKKDK